MILENMQMLYSANKNKKVGERCICPSCGCNFVKKTYQQAFCNKKGKVNKHGQRTLCKDQYHNTINESRRPYNRDYYYGKISTAKMIERERSYEDWLEDEDNCHPYSEDAFSGCSDEIQ